MNATHIILAGTKVIKFGRTATEPHQEVTIGPTSILVEKEELCYRDKDGSKYSRNDDKGVMPMHEILNWAECLEKTKFAEKFNFDSETANELQKQAQQKTVIFSIPVTCTSGNDTAKVTEVLNTIWRVAMEDPKVPALLESVGITKTEQFVPDDDYDFDDSGYDDDYDLEDNENGYDPEMEEFGEITND